MDDLKRKRAEKKHDCREWDATDALEDALLALKGNKNKIKIMIHWWEVQEDGTQDHYARLANLTAAEHIALLEMAKAQAMDDWRK